MPLSIEELVVRILTFLTKELEDPTFMAELVALLTALNNWLEAQVVAQGGTPVSTGSTGSPAPTPAPSPAAAPAAVANVPGLGARPAIKPPVYHK